SPHSLQLAASFLLLSTFVTGQSLEKPMIALGDALVHPLEEVSLPVQLSGLEGEAVVHLRLKIQFAAVPLNFVRVEINQSDSTLSVHTNLEFETQKPETQDSDSQLESETQDSDTQNEEKIATLLLEADSVEPSSAGELLEVIFEATDEIYENEELVIKIVEASLTTANGGQVQELNLEDGKVTISIPLFSCLFYMH
ncbi:hypothetical protein MYX82_02580, partial [Acidobacteria bacterium AH-259-D05]|nr:hypothetical protein [Acidobacteria bacterium AH-259-D05]